jgi:ABC-type glycerol-3-phosphate transport system substrate-binding protein
MKPQLSRRRFLQGLSGAVALVGLSACAPAAGPAATGEEAARQEIEVFVGGTFQPEVARGEGLTPLLEARRLADEWEAEHTDAQIVYVSGPGGEGIEQWVKALQAAGTMPDILNAVDNWLNRDIGTGYWVQIDDYVDEPNNYIPAGELGRDRWRDAFIAGFDARNRMIDGNYYGVPQAINGVQIFCNLDILEASGVDFDSELINPRWTFDGMLEISQRIQDAGHSPWSLAWVSPYWNWIQTTALSGFLKSTGHWGVMDTNNDDFVTSIERFKAIDRGDWRADSVEFRAMHQMAQDWTAYWSEGFLGLTSQEMSALFARGEAAFWWSTSNSYPVMQNDPLREFEFAIARFPLCFDRMATIGEGGPTQYPGGAYNTIAMTATAKEKGTIDSCVDFMKLFTSCEGQGRLATEHGGVVPAVFCAQGRPELEQFKPDVGETFLKTIHMTSMHFDYGATYWRVTSEWLGGTLSYDEAMAKFQPIMEQFATDAIERAEA